MTPTQRGLIMTLARNWAAGQDGAEHALSTYLDALRRDTLLSERAAHDKENETDRDAFTGELRPWYAVRGQPVKLRPGMWEHDEPEAAAELAALQASLRDEE